MRSQEFVSEAKVSIQDQILADITWLRARPGSMQAGVTVVPEMQ
jgi:hypothetical protein